MRGRSLRRLLLACAFIAWASPLRLAAGSPQLEAELNQYGGTASGTFTGGSCLAAPAARVYYQGIAGRVALRPEQLERRSALGVRVGRRAPVGPVLELAGAVQVERYALLEPGETRHVDDVPPRRLRTVVASRLGYDWLLFGMKGGLLLRQVQGEVDVEHCMQQPGTCPEYGNMTFEAFPDLSLRFGPSEPLHLDVGLGAYSLPTLMQPGLYAGLTAQHRGLRLALHAGEHLTFHGHGSPRFDLACAIPATRTLRVIGGVSLSEGYHDASELEGRVGLELILPGKRSVAESR